MACGDAQRAFGRQGASKGLCFAGEDRQRFLGARMNRGGDPTGKGKPRRAARQFFQ